MNDFRPPTWFFVAIVSVGLASAGIGISGLWADDGYLTNLVSSLTGFCAALLFIGPLVRVLQSRAQEDRDRPLFMAAVGSGQLILGRLTEGLAETPDAKELSDHGEPGVKEALEELSSQWRKKAAFADDVSRAGTSEIEASLGEIVTTDTPTIERMKTAARYLSESVIPRISKVDPRATRSWVWATLGEHLAIALFAVDTNAHIGESFRSTGTSVRLPSSSLEHPRLGVNEKRLSLVGQYYEDAAELVDRLADLVDWFNGTGVTASVKQGEISFNYEH